MNFSLTEIIYILLIALLVVKPEQLPDVARSLGRMIKSARGIYQKVKAEVDGIIEEKEKPAIKENEHTSP